MTTLCQYLAAQCLASGVRCAVAICVVLLVRLPSALTRLRGCCPRALLSPYVQPRLRCSITCPSRQGHRHWRAGRRPLPCQLRALQWVQGVVGEPGTLQHLGQRVSQTSGFLPRDWVSSDLKGSHFSLKIGEIFISTFLKSFCCERFQVKCVSSHVF